MDVSVLALGVLALGVLREGEGAVAPRWQQARGLSLCSHHPRHPHPAQLAHHQSRACTSSLRTLLLQRGTHVRRARRVRRASSDLHAAALQPERTS